MAELFDVFGVAVGDGRDPGAQVCFLDAPAGGRVTAADAVEIVGWLLGADTAAVAVEVLRDGELLAREPVNLARPDVAAAFPTGTTSGRDGFRAAVDVTGGPPGVALEVRGVLADGRRVPIGVVRGRRRWRRSAATGAAVVLAGTADAVAATLASIRAQGDSGLEVVVAGASAAASAGRFPEARAVGEVTGTRAAAWNAGIRATTGEYVLLLEPGARLSPGAFAVAVRALASDPDAGFAAGRMAGPTGALVVPRDFREALRSFPGLGPLAATAHRRAALEDVGGLDERFGALAGPALLLRLLRETRPVLVDAVLCEHAGAPDPVDPAAALVAALRALASHSAYVRRHPGDRDAYRAARATCEALYGPGAAAAAARLGTGAVRGALAGLVAVMRSAPVDERLP
jgi:hypothetical protein